MRATGTPGEVGGAIVVAHREQLAAEVRAHQQHADRADGQQDQHRVRQLLDHRHALDAAAADRAEALRQRARGRAFVHRKTAPCRISSMPSVVMNDGTRRRVVTVPLKMPTAAPWPAAAR
jgi:hypothetical protein